MEKIKKLQIQYNIFLTLSILSLIHIALKEFPHGNAFLSEEGLAGIILFPLIFLFGPLIGASLSLGLSILFDLGIFLFILVWITHDQIKKCRRQQLDDKKSTSKTINPH